MKRWLYLDLRSLALWRICLGLVVLLDLAIRLTDLTAHYTDAGVCPRVTVLERYPDAGWSLHMLSGDWCFELFLFAVHVICALAFTAGYRTFWSNLLTWLLLVSLHHRNPAVCDCGDFYLRMLLLWGLFMPLGKRCSLDSLVGPEEPGTQWFGAGALAYPAQITMVYLFAALWKNDPCWTASHTAVYLALSLLSFATPRAQWLLARPQLMEFLTVATLQFEFVGPIFLWLPGVVRFVGILGIIVLHLGLGLFIHLGVFPLIAMAAPLGLLPSIFWRARFPKLSAVGEKGGRWLVFRLPHPKAPPVLPRWLCALLLLLVLVGNINNHRGEVGYDRAWNSPERALGLDQCWNMFAPHPPGVDGWYVIDAVRCDGNHFDLYAALYGEHKNLTWEKPEFVASTFHNARWRKLMEYMREDTVWRRPYAFYLTRLWNLAHADQEQKVYSFQVFFLEVTTPKVGERAAPPVRKLLWSHQCFPTMLTLPDGRVLGKSFPERSQESVMQNSDY